MTENILCSLGGMPHLTASSVSPLGEESFSVCRKRAQCLLLFLSEKFNGKQRPIMKCLGSGAVFTVSESLVLTQALRCVSKNTHHGMPQIRSIKAIFSNVNLVFSFIKLDQSIFSYRQMMHVFQEGRKK